MTGKPAGLALTGERTVPDIRHENYWFRRHEAGYRWALRTVDVHGCLVLDAGSGEGYGAQLLADAGAAAVLALDLDPTVLAHAARRYRGVAAVQANLVHLPVASGAVDVVVSSQTVEHLWDQDRFVHECARVLRPGGRLLVTTPNRHTFPAGNAFHSRELDADELAGLLADHLEVESVRGVHHGPRLAAAGDVVAAQLAGPPEAWAPALAALVGSVTVDDFTVGDPAGGLDLVAVAVRR